MATRMAASRPRRWGATLATLAVLAALLASVLGLAAAEEAPAEPETAGVGDEEDFAKDVVQLSGADLDPLVYRTQHAWAVLVTASQGCPQCEALEGLLDATARSMNGLVKFGTLDVLDSGNVMALGGNLAQLGVPQLRLYVEPGQRNAYKKDEFYRDHIVYSGQQNARAMKRFLQEAMLQNAPVDVLSATNYSTWAKQVQAAGAGGGVVVLSSKKQPSATVAALARLAQGSGVRVGQFSNFDAGSEDAAAVDAAFGGIGGSAPRLCATKLDTGSWVGLDLSAAQKASLPAIVAFLAAEAGLHVGVSGTASGDGAGDGSADKSSAASAQEAGILNSAARLQDEALAHKMPIVLAARVTGAAQAPPEWDKFRSKSHGVLGVVMHCDKLGADDAEALAAICREDGTDLVRDGETAWAVVEWDFSRNVKEEPRTIAGGTRADSLSEARSKALASIPDVVMKLPDGSMLQNFIGMALQSHLLPVVLLGNKPDPPAMLVSAAAAAEGLALVAYRANPTEEELQTSFGMPPGMSVPQLAAIVTEGTAGKDEVRMLVSLYDRNMYGKFSYQRILGFMIQVAQSVKDESAQGALRDWVREHGAAVGVRIQGDPGADSGADPDADAGAGAADVGASSGPLDDASQEMSVISSAEDWERLCPADGPSPQLLCAIGFLDGDPLNADLGAQKALLQEVRKKLLGTPSGGAKLRFMWVDATCHSAFLDGFRMDATGLPTLGVYHPRKQVLFRMFQGLSVANAEKFLISIASGFGKNSETLDARPAIDEEVDCQALPSRAGGAAAVVDDAGAGAGEDEDDFLAEIRAEEEAERKRRKLEVKEEMELLKQQKKKQKEEEEREAAAAAANARRRRRRRRRKAKDEL